MSRFTHLSARCEELSIRRDPDGDTVRWRVSATAFAFSISIRPDGEVDVEQGKRRAQLELDREEAAELEAALHAGQIGPVLGLLKETREAMQGIPADV